jgi:hypothetical protein
LKESDEGKSKESSQLLLRKALDETIRSLGGPISKTIMWHMNNRGVFSDSKDIDIKAFYSNLKELIGPGADMIMDEVWQKIKKEQGIQLDYRDAKPVDMIVKMTSGGVA